MHDPLVLQILNCLDYFEEHFQLFVSVILEVFIVRQHVLQILFFSVLHQQQNMVVHLFVIEYLDDVVMVQTHQDFVATLKLHKTQSLHFQY